MSSREKLNGAGSPAANKAAPLPKQIRRGRDLRADFLLNFQRPPAHQRPHTYVPPRRTSTRQTGRPAGSFAKGRFVQSSFRLFVENATPDVLGAAVHADALLDWGSVRRVELLCEQAPKCPICLEESLVVPKITRCGHLFCLPCVMRYFLLLREYNGKQYQRCPICNEQVAPEDLISARCESVEPLSEGGHVSFVLVHRDVDSTILRLPRSQEPERGADARVLPQQGDPGWHLNRLVQLKPGEAARILTMEIEDLHLFRAVSLASGDTELLPSAAAGIELLQRQLQSPEKRAQGLEVPSEGASPDLYPDPETTDATYRSQLGEDLMLPPGPDDLDEEVSQDAEDPEYEEEGLRIHTGPSTIESTPILGPGTSPAVGPATSPSPSQSASGATSSASRQGHSRGSSTVSFYQCSNGRPLFFQPFFMKLLLHEHGGRWSELPHSLPDLGLERMHEEVVTEETRRRHRFLAHLPLGSPFTLAEVDLRAHLSRETKEHFAEEFSKRRQQRRKDQIRSSREDRLSKTRAAEEEERYYQSLNLPQSFVVQALPTKEDFAAALPGREGPLGREGQGSRRDHEATGDAEEDDAEGGPTLADKIKEKLAKGKAKSKSRSVIPELGGANFPGLGEAGSAASASSAATVPGPGSASGSAWGKGCGSSRVTPAPKREGGKASEAAGGEALSQSAEEPRPNDEPTFGEALEAALKSAVATGQQVGPEHGEDSAGVRKKKGRSGKATTIRLFG